jgi:hypothetical protein
MNTKSLVILVVLLVAGALAYFYSTADRQINSADSIGAPILPGLFESLNEVTSVSIIGAGEQALATIKRVQDQWVLAERGNYPADLAKIRSAVLALAEAKIIEEKTSSDLLYAKLGVEDVSASDATGIKVTVTYGDQQQLIVGNPGPQINKTRYVRRANEKTSWLVDRKIDLKHEAPYWLQKDILSVEPAEISTISLRLQDGATLEIFNHKHDEEDVFAVSNLTNPDAQVIEAEIHQITNALSSFQLLDVEDRATFSAGEPTYTIKYMLKSGVSLELVAYEIEKDHFVAINPATSSSQQTAQDYVANLKKITGDWVFKIPNVTYDSMLKREADILAITEDQLN